MTSAERQTLGGPRTRGTDSWLDDTDKNFGPDLLCYCLNCTKFGQLILRKIIKIVATRCPILRLKCTKFDFGWGAPPQTPKLDLKGPTSKGREGREGKGEREGKEVQELGGDGRERKKGKGWGRHSMSCLRAPQT